MQRRQFLKATGITLALPHLETFGEKVITNSASSNGVPRRTVFIGNSLGVYQPAFFPKEAGENYKITPLLKPLEAHRRDFSVFSNLDHGVKGGHHATESFLSGVKQVDAKTMPNGNITVDQRMGEIIGSETRFTSMNIIASKVNGSNGSDRMSWTRNSVKVPAIKGPKSLFQIMFGLNRSSSSGKDSFELHGSILDQVMVDAKRLNRRLSKRDQEKLGEYFNSVRDVERKIQQREHWQNVPYPKPKIKQPENDDVVSDVTEMYDLIALALELDLTRVVAFELPHNSFRSGDLGITKDYHFLSHHGKLKENIDALITLQTYEITEFSKFLTKLKSIKQSDGSTLFDATAVLFGSGMGNAASHLNTELPIILAGGGYKLGEHRIMPAASNQRVPLCNMFVSLLNRMGVEDDIFGVSSGSFPGLEIA